jgi:transcription initiation factor TFIIIB Brf1 subunit/transcription initiation factor TFIIB
LAARKRGRKSVRDARDRELARLTRELTRLRRKLAQAEAVIEIQKKLALQAFEWVELRGSG